MPVRRRSSDRSHSGSDPACRAGEPVAIQGSPVEVLDRLLPASSGRGGSHRLAQRIRVGDVLLGLEGAWANRRCHILGNGPSLRMADLSRLSDDRVIGVNASPLLDGELGRAADVYCVSDRRFLLDPRKGRIAAATMASTRVFAGYCSGLIADDDVQFVRILGSVGASADLRCGIYHGGSVVCFAAQIALWTGASEIMLHGCEFDYGAGRFYEGAKGNGAPDPRAFAMTRRTMSDIVRIARERGTSMLCAGQSRLLGDWGCRPVPNLRRVEVTHAPHP